VRPLSYLYVPGSAGDRLQQAAQRGADALILDLEDGVAPDAKDQARAAVADYLSARPAGPGELWVRINSGDLGQADVAAVVTPALAGVCLPKAGGVGDLRALDELLSRAEQQAGLPVRSVAVCPLIESAAGLAVAMDIARGPRVRRLQLGEADLAADLNLEPGLVGTELLLARSLIVMASRAASLPAPIAAVSVNFRDLDRFRTETESLRRLGFRGRACIHPSQIPVVHEVFMPSASDLAEAQAIVRVYDDMLARGAGAGVDQRGRMLDEAVVRTARQVIAACRREDSSSPEGEI
jgi:citrate lyase subunit beta/citryl-CoA lyase